MDFCIQSWGVGSGTDILSNTKEQLSLSFFCYFHLINFSFCLERGKCFQCLNTLSDLFILTILHKKKGQQVGQSQVFNAILSKAVG